MNEMLAQIKAAWNALGMRQQATLVISAALTVAAIGAMVWWAQQPSWTTLYTGLEPKDSQAVIQELQQRKVPFQMVNGGSAIEVPIEQVDKLRVELASKGLPGSGRFGFLEMFAGDTMAQSDRTQRMRYQKALEDELSRTIESIDEVRSARVHLVLPGDRVFLDDHDVAKASVMLGLKRGTVPTAENVRAIVHIVASAVEGLAPERVSLVDTQGRSLWEADGVGGGLATARQMEMKGAVEKDINSKVARVLEPLVGSEKYVVRTSVDVDFQKVVRREKQIDPDSAALVSEQKSKERSSSSQGVSGVPGTASNLPGAVPPGGGSGAENSESNTVTNNFEYSVVERTVEEPVGSVKRLSIAVLLDHAAKPGSTTGESAPRSAEEIRKIDQLVKAAINFDATRGDVVTVEQMAFQPPPVETPRGVDWKQYLPYLKYPLLVVALLLVFLLFFRPFMKTARDAVSRGKDPRRPALPGAPASAGRAEVEGAHLLGPASQVELMRQRLAKLAAEQPQGMAQTVRVWLNEPKESA